MASDLPTKLDVFSDNLFSEFEPGQVNGESTETISIEEDHDGELLKLRRENDDLKERLRLFQQLGTQIAAIEEFLHQIVSIQCNEKPRDNNVPAVNSSEQASSDNVDGVNRSQEVAQHVNSELNVTANILLYRGFVVDTIGAPSNANVAQTNGTIVGNIPYYSQEFETVLPCSKAEKSIRLARNRRSCFNCGRSNHALKDCPEPHDQNRIAERRREFQENQTPSSVRYHGEESTPKTQQDRFSHFRPGHISERLRSALGLLDSDLPPYIYRMRMLGYPPGYKLAEQLGQQIVLPSLQLYGSEDDCNGENTCNEVSEILYPGFNASPPSGVQDQWRELGFPAPTYCTSPESKKRRCSDDETDHPSAKRVHPSSGDMEIDFDLEEGELPDTPGDSPCAKLEPSKRKTTDHHDGVLLEMESNEQSTKEDVATPSSPPRNWSTDFPPDMAPVDQELKHRWLTLQKIVKQTPRKSRQLL